MPDFKITDLNYHATRREQRVIRSLPKSDSVSGLVGATTSRRSGPCNQSF